MKKLLPVIAAFLVGAVSAQEQISTGGPIPDRRGFNTCVDQPNLVSQVHEVLRKVAGNVYVIAGAGGNVVAQVGPDGVLLVDDNFQVFYPKIMAAIRQISDKPVRIVINTHWHPDHNENNANFAKQGALVFGQPATRAWLQRLKVPPEGLPTVTSSAPMTFYFNGEEVSYVPLKPSHTSGDVGVYFHGSDVFAFGDDFTTDYPAITVAEGGSVRNYVDNYNLALQMTTDNTAFVPGHGQLSKRSDVIAVRDAIQVVHERFVAMVKQGKTLDEIRKARPSKEFDARFATENWDPNPFQNSTMWYQQMYDDARVELGMPPSPPGPFPAECWYVKHYPSNFANDTYGSPRKR